MGHATSKKCLDFGGDADREFLNHHAGYGQLYHFADNSNFVSEFYDRMECPTSSKSYISIRIHQFMYVLYFVYV